MGQRAPSTVVRGRKRRRRRGPLVVLACAVLAAGSFYGWSVLRPRSPAVAADPSVVPPGRAAVPLTVAATPTAVDPVAATVAANALLTPEAAGTLADAWKRRGLATDDLGETALLLALKGFGTVPADQADALRSSFERLYAALSPTDRGTAERLLSQIREGRADTGDLAQARVLMDLGARQMDEASRSQLRKQYSGAVIMAVAMRDESDRIAAAGPAVYVAEARVPEVTQARTSSPPHVIPSPSPPSGGSAAWGSGPESGGGDRRGEAYWRDRAAQLRRSVARAQAAVTATETALRGEILREQPRDCSLPPGLTMEQIKRWKCYVGSAVPAARAKHERAQAELDRAQKALHGLDDEARRAGALPGWLRE
jgi:hypothetical protein